MPAVLVAVSYLPSLRGPFLFDDAVAVQTNLSIRTLGWSIFSPPDYTPVAARPLVNASFALNHAAGGFAPAGFRIVNLALHLACVLVLWWLVRRTLKLPVVDARLRANSDLLAISVAALWGLHPLLVDAVAYITQRSELLFSLFYLLALAFAVRGLTDRRVGWLLISATACLAGMACKEVMVSAPLAVLLYDRTFIAGSFRTALSRSRAFYAALAATWVLLIILVLQGGRSESSGLGLGISPWQYLLTQTRVMTWYLSRAFWPMDLAISHQIPVASSPSEVLPEAIFTLLLIAATVWALRFHPQAGFLAACYFMLLAPTSSIVPIVSELAAERRMYLPLAALTALVVSCVGMRVPVRPLAAVAAGLALVLGMATFRHSRAYGDALLAWDNALAVDPRNETALINRGTVLVARGQLDEAMESFRRAAEVNRFSVLARHNIGMIYMSQRRFAEASQMFTEALRIQPRAVTAAQQLAVSYVLQNRMREAADAYAAALNLAGDWSQGLNDLAWIRATSPIDDLRNGAEAVRLATRACALSGGRDASMLDTLGAAHAESGDFVAATAAVDRAIALAEASGSSDLTGQLRARRELYRQQKPYRDPAG